MDYKHINNWAYIKLKDVGDIMAGDPAPQQKEYFSDKGIPFVRVADLGQQVENVYIYNTRDKINIKKNNKLRLFPKGSVLFTKSGMSLLLNQRAILGSDMYVVSHIGIINPFFPIKSEWIYFWLKTIDFEKYAHATTLPSLKLSIIKELKIPLPPLNEQNQIVEKIEELFSELDKAKEELQKAREQLKVYRQSVLKAAFEGKLTEEWRKNKTHNKIINNQQKNEIKNGKLPENYKLLKISKIGEVITGTTPSKKNKDYYGDEYPFFKPTDLEAGYNVRIAREYLSSEGIKKARILPPNSILVTCIGATIGKTGIIRKEGACNQQINAIVPYDFLNSNFVYYQAISPFFQEQILLKSSSTTLPILNKSRFKELLFIFTDIGEQEQIVLEIESRLSVCDKIEESVESGLIKIEHLRQGILKKAFEGELVPQDPNDLPAEELLKQIKIEKEKIQNNSKKKVKR